MNYFTVVLLHVSLEFVEPIIYFFNDLIQGFFVLLEIWF